MEPQILFREESLEYLDLLNFVPDKVDIVDIVHFDQEAPLVKTGTLDASEIEGWVNSPLLAAQQSRQSRLLGGLRIILNTSTGVEAGAYISPLEFPANYSLRAYINQIPFQRETLQSIIKTFNLPLATAWSFSCAESHFQSYRLQTLPHQDKETQDIGAIMRICGGGSIGVELAIAMSHSPDTGITHAIIMGASPLQALAISKEIVKYAQLTYHPAFLFVLVSQYCRKLLDARRWEVQSGLVAAAKESGHYGFGFRPNEHKEIIDYKRVTKDVLSVIQELAVTQQQCPGLFRSFEGIKKFIEHVNSITPCPRTALAVDQGLVLCEMLGLVTQTTQVLIDWMISLRQEAMALQTALYSYMAINESQLNAMVARDSREIAAAGKRDSYAMKSISIVTMLFLPGTFVATLFATPAIEKAAPPQWVYWVVTTQLTLAVMVLWGIWYRWSNKKISDEEAAKARSAAGQPAEKISSREDV